MSARQKNRFHSPEAEIVWAAVEKLDVAEKTALLRVLSYEVAVRPFLSETTATREGRAVLALHEAFERLRCSPSLREYERLRKEDPSLDWPKEKQVRTWLGSGSWNDALRRAGLESVPDGEVMVRETTGIGFTAEEAIAALKGCATAIGVSCPTYHRYAAWVRRPEVQERPGRRPMSLSSFQRLFGGFREACVAAGLVAGVHVNADGELLHPLKGSWEREDCINALREVAERLGHPPGRGEYMAARKQIERHSIEQESRRLLPSDQVISRWFGTWPAALIAAELVLENEARLLRVHRYSGDQILEALRSCWMEVGEPFTSTAYAGWREKRLREAAGAGEDLRLPSLETIRDHFGRWSTALQLALAERSASQKRRRRRVRGR